MINSIPKWSEITREERFFTAILFHAMKNNVSPFWGLLRKKLKITEDLLVVDIGYEVCMLRDLAHKQLIQRVKEREKQTFDLVLTLSDNSMVLIEVKAHQRFSKKQFDLIRETRETLLKQGSIDIKTIHIAGICSDKYTPSSCRDIARVTWAELAENYPENKEEFKRANDIFDN